MNPKQIRQKIKQKSTQELKKHIESTSTYGQIYDWHVSEYKLRLQERSTKIHWTVWLIIFIAIIAAIFGGISTWPIIKSWFQ